jgi:hypothetical protein
MSAAYVRQIASGAFLALAMWTTVAVAFLALGPEFLPVVMSPDAPRVSSIVGARYDNFVPSVELDTSQVERGAPVARPDYADVAR